MLSYLKHQSQWQTVLLIKPSEIRYITVSSSEDCQLLICITSRSQLFIDICLHNNQLSDRPLIFFSGQISSFFEYLIINMRRFIQSVDCVVYQYSEFVLLLNFLIWYHTLFNVSVVTDIHCNKSLHLKWRRLLISQQVYYVDICFVICLRHLFPNLLINFVFLWLDESRSFAKKLNESEMITVCHAQKLHDMMFVVRVIVLKQIGFKKCVIII
jgi:hypothetical protein